ncbi:MAG: hypothetical protein RBR35_16910 [Salinivirgaceae bacterium]|nr:hypothetical protein [Salinivirgaceae bacterium]
MWKHGGYIELQNPPKRYSILDIDKLIDLCGCSSEAQFRSTHNQLVKDSIQSGCCFLQPDWSEAIAVGSQQFIADIHNQLNCKPFGRKILKRVDTFILREASDAYDRHLLAKKTPLSTNNSYYLPINCVESGG